MSSHFTSRNESTEIWFLVPWRRPGQRDMDGGERTMAQLWCRRCARDWVGPSSRTACQEHAVFIPARWSRMWDWFGAEKDWAV